MALQPLSIPRMPSNKELGEDLQRAIDAVRDLDALQAKLPGVDRLLRIADATHSARLTSVSDVLVYERGRMSPPERRPEEMVMACVDAFYDGRDRFDPLKILRVAHRRVFSNSPDRNEVRWAGYMRQEGDPIGSTASDRWVAKSAVVRSVRQWAAFLTGEDKGVHPLVRACVAHGMLAAISPFHAGNGEISRMLLPLSYRWLAGRGYGSASVGEAWHENAETYDWAIEESFLRNDARTLTRVLLAMIEQDAVRNADRLRQIVVSRKQWKSEFSGARPDHHVHRMVDWIAVRPIFDLTKAAAALQISATSFYKSAGILVDAGILTISESRPWVFSTPDVMALFDNSRPDLEDEMSVSTEPKMGVP